MQKRACGHKKQDARFGHTKIQGKSLLVRGLNALAAVVSTPLSAPVIAATRLRGGNAASARGAASLAAQAIGTARHDRGHITLHLPEAWHREQEWLNLLRPDPPRKIPRAGIGPEAVYRNWPVDRGLAGLTAGAAAV